MRDIDELIIHCSDSTFGDASRIKEWHLERGWSDIGYHYVICNGYKYKGEELGANVLDGEIQVGRPIERAGAHARGHNTHSVGICLIGVDEFTELQFMALENLVKGLQVQFGIPSQNVLGHYEVDTHGKTCPNFSMACFRMTL